MWTKISKPCYALFAIPNVTFSSQMSSDFPPPQIGSLTDSEGGEGRFLVQWLRGSLSAERGARKAAQRSVASLESRLASLERQLQGQQPKKSSPKKSRLRISSGGGADGVGIEGEGGVPRGEELPRANGAHERASPKRGRRSNEFEGSSLESAAWRAFQTFSAEMARIADEREARQGGLERKVDNLAQRVESLQPRAPQSAGQSSGGNFPATNTDSLTVFNVAPDYHDGPRTFSGGSGAPGKKSSGERARGLPQTPEGKYENVILEGAGKNQSRKSKEAGGGWKPSFEPRERDEGRHGGVSGERGESEPPKVDSLAIWGELPWVPGAHGRPPLELVDCFPESGSFSLGPLAAGRASLIRTSSEGDAIPWNKSEGIEDSAQPVNKGVESQGPEYSEAQVLEESARVPSPELQHGALYSPLDDDSVWESILSGVPKEAVLPPDPPSLEIESPSVTEALARLRGHLDRRMFEVGKSNGMVNSRRSLETELGKGTEGERRPSQMPYVTLPNTPLHEGAGLRSQLSRTDSGASSDFH